MTVSVDTTKTGDQGSLFSTLAIQAGGVLAMAVGSTFNLYNTADQTTNYERLRAYWTGNVAAILMQHGGSATPRAILIGVIGSGATHQYASAQISSTGHQFAWVPNGSSGTQTGISVAPAINQSGTAGYTALDINPTESATGSGTKLLQRWAVGGTAVSNLTNTGYFNGVRFIASQVLGLSGSLGGADDVQLTRDAADILALRRGTNAQTFHVYNTYTDASNYERGIAGWISNTYAIGTFNAGTGANRPIGFYTNSLARWVITADGHFLANNDNTYDIGASGANRPRNIYVGSGIVAGGVISTTNYISALYSIIIDGVTAPAATVGQAKLYVDTADGDLKIIFGDGTIKTIVTDT